MPFYEHLSGDTHPSIHFQLFRRLAACHRRPPFWDTAFRCSSPLVCNAIVNLPLRVGGSGEPFGLPRGVLEGLVGYVASCGAKMSGKEAARWLRPKTLGAPRAILISKTQCKNDVAQNGSKTAPRHLLKIEGFSGVSNVSFDM